MILGVAILGSALAVGLRGASINPHDSQDAAVAARYNPVAARFYKAMGIATSKAKSCTSSDDFGTYVSSACEIAALRMIYDALVTFQSQVHAIKMPDWATAAASALATSLADGKQTDSAEQTCWSSPATAKATNCDEQGAALVQAGERLATAERDMYAALGE